MHGVVEVGERRHRHHGAEDLLLEDPHRVLALEDGGGDVVPAGEVSTEVHRLATTHQAGAFVLPDLDVVQDLVVLLLAGLRTDHGVAVQRVALYDLLGALGGIDQELVEDRLLDQRPARAGADLALVQREHREALERLVIEVVVLQRDVVEEDVRALAAEFQGDRNDVLAGVLHDQLAGRGLAGEGDLGDAIARGKRLAGFEAEPVHHVEDTLGQQVADEIHQPHDRGRGLFGRLEHDGVAGGQSRCDLPHGHQDREVPRDDLAHDTQGLVEVIGDGVVIELRQRAFLGAQNAGEVAEVVDGQGDIGSQGLPHRLAVVPGLDDGDRLEVLLHAVGDLEQDVATIAGGHTSPRGCRGVRGVEGKFDVLGSASGDLAERLAVHGGHVLEVLALDGGDTRATDPVVITRFEFCDASGGSRGCVDRHADLLLASGRVPDEQTLCAAALQQRCTFGARGRGQRRGATGPERGAGNP